MDTPLIQTVDLVKYFNTKRGPLHAVDRERVRKVYTGKNDLTPFGTYIRFGSL